MKTGALAPWGGYTQGAMSAFLRAVFDAGDEAWMNCLMASSAEAFMAPTASQLMRERRAKQAKEHAKQVEQNRREREQLERAETEPPKESA